VEKSAVVFGFERFTLWCALFVVCLLFVAFSFGFLVVRVVFVSFQSFSKIVCDYTRFFNVFCCKYWFIFCLRLFNYFLVKGVVFIGFKSFSKNSWFLMSFPVFQRVILSFFSAINGLYWFVCDLIVVLMVLLVKGLFLSVSNFVFLEV
jgi:hypothetical protein